MDLRRLYEQDQLESEQPDTYAQSWRLGQALQLIKTNALTAENSYYAAVLLSRSDQVDHLKLASELAQMSKNQGGFEPPGVGAVNSEKLLGNIHDKLSKQIDKDKLRPSPSTQQRRCTKCDRPGHFAAICTNPPKYKRG